MSARVKKVVYFKVNAKGSKSQLVKTNFSVAGQSESAVVHVLKNIGANKDHDIVIKEIDWA